MWIIVSEVSRERTLRTKDAHNVFTPAYLPENSLISTPYCSLLGFKYRNGCPIHDTDDLA